MNTRDYIQVPLREYNRLPLFETNVMDTLDDISVMRAMIAGLRKYADYLESVTKERETEIWDKMKCAEDAKHFEDYMNKPESGTRRTHATAYFVSDSVIDGTDKTPCMYDYVENILNGRDDIAICKAVHKNSNHGDCAQCTEPCCSQSGVNNK